MPVRHIHKAPLKALAEEYLRRAKEDPSQRVGEPELDEIMATVGDQFLMPTALLRQRFAREPLSPEAKLDITRAGITFAEQEDLRALVTDPAFVSLLEPAAAAGLSALAGFSFADDVATGPSGLRAPNMRFSDAQLEAVQEFKRLFEAGELTRMYEAVTGAVNDPSLEAAARSLFDALPPMSPASNAEAFVAAGYWASPPRGLDDLEKSPRYLEGRQVLVRTTVHPELFDERDFLSYKSTAEGGREAVTYRASIAGEDGDAFLVRVDGRSEPLRVPKEEVFALNQPHDTEALKTGEHAYQLIGGGTDYDDPLLKAKVAEAALKIAPLVRELDFHAAIAAGGAARRQRKHLTELQRRAVIDIHDVMDMKYPSEDFAEPGRRRGGGAGQQAMRGLGICFDQAGVMLAMLMPFQKSLGVDAQFMMGGVYRNVTERGQDAFRKSGHGWLQLTYRPSMELRIIDRTWLQADQPADKAYSRYGDRYPAGHRWGFLPQAVNATDVDMAASTEAAPRQFGEAGVDGRDQHMSTRQ
ncbi:MAG: hypothetical protein ACO3JL_08755 [Myxococcota bacterium]